MRLLKLQGHIYEPVLSPPGVVFSVLTYSAWLVLKLHYFGGCKLKASNAGGQSRLYALSIVCIRSRLLTRRKWRLEFVGERITSRKAI
jgi:hypothetical protein